MVKLQKGSGIINIIFQNDNFRNGFKVYVQTLAQSK